MAKKIMETIDKLLGHVGLVRKSQIEEARITRDRSVIAGRGAVQGKLNLCRQECRKALQLEVQGMPPEAKAELSEALKELAATLPTEGIIKYSYLPSECQSKVDKLVEKVLTLPPIQRFVEQYKQAVTELCSIFDESDGFRPEYEWRRAEQRLYSTLGSEILVSLRDTSETGLVGVKEPSAEPEQQHPALEEIPEEGEELEI